MTMRTPERKKWLPPTLLCGDRSWQLNYLFPFKGNKKSLEFEFLQCEKQIGSNILIIDPEMAKRRIPIPKWLQVRLCSKEIQNLFTNPGASHLFKDACDDNHNCTCLIAFGLVQESPAWCFWLIPSKSERRRPSRNKLNKTQAQQQRTPSVKSERVKNDDLSLFLGNFFKKNVNKSIFPQ